MTLLPSFYLSATVSIEKIHNTDDGPQSRGIGTGFLLGLIEGTNDDNETLYRLVLITNKHVVENESLLWLRFNEGKNAKLLQMSLETDDGPLWQTADGHDVAAVAINYEKLREEGAEFSWIREDFSLTTEQMVDAGIQSGDGIFVLGFPMNLGGEVNKTALVRGGVLARFDANYVAAEKTFLVDCAVFPGNSGGPVVTKPEMVSIKGTKAYGHASLIGCVCSYIPYIDHAISPQTKRPRISFEENSGLAHVVPFNAIREAGRKALRLPDAPKIEPETETSAGGEDVTADDNATPEL